MGLRERVENNVVIILLGALLTGFGSGIGAFQFVIDVSGRKLVPEATPTHVSPPSCEVYGVTIAQRVEAVAENHQDVVVHGGLASLPPRSELWVAATGPSGSRWYYPRDKVRTDDNSWSLTLDPGLKGPEDVKHFAVFIVGESGQTLFQQYREIMKALAPKQWPPLTATTSDMVLCPGRYEVRLK